MVRTSSSSPYTRTHSSRSTSKTRRDNSIPRKPKPSSSSRHVYKDSTKDKSGSSDDYLVNDVVGFEEFGEAQDVLRLFQFKDKVRTNEELKRNVLIKIEVRKKSNIFCPFSQLKLLM